MSTILSKKKKSNNQNIWQLRGHISDMMSYSAFSYSGGNWQAVGMEHIFFKIPFGQREVKMPKPWTKSGSSGIKANN